MFFSKEKELFFKRFIKHPFRMGSPQPTSWSLIHKAAKHVLQDLSPEANIVDIGSGTGRFLKSLLDKGIDPSRLIAVELDPAMCVSLRENFPGVRVIEGSLFDPLVQEAIQKAGVIEVVFSGIPLSPLSPKERSQLWETYFSWMPKHGKLLHLTCIPFCPFLIDPLSQKKCLGYSYNVPPIFLWEFRSHASHQDSH